MFGFIAAPAYIHRLPLEHAEADYQAWLETQHEAKAADLAEMDLAATLSHPATRELLRAARTVLDTDGRYGMPALSAAVQQFAKLENVNGR